MKVIGIIPARFASTRFPGKPLADINGKSMILRVYEQCLKSNLDELVVATDDERIFDHVKSFKGTAVMTSSAHQNGTNRIAEAAKKMKLSADSIVVNIQGDEPFISPSDINLLVDCFTDHTVEIATLIKKISSTETLMNPNSPKVVVNGKKQALYFSRAPIPHLKDLEMKNWLKEQDFFQHLGIYAFRYDVLEKIAKLSPSPLEQAESLEQLGWMENGFRIQTAETNTESIAVDTKEDLKRIHKKFFS